MNNLEWNNNNNWKIKMIIMEQKSSVKNIELIRQT